MVFYCPHCSNWIPLDECEIHFKGFHNQEGMTEEKLAARFSVLGVWDVREEIPQREVDEKNRVVETNNWTHKD